MMKATFEQTHRLKCLVVAAACALPLLLAAGGGGEAFWVTNRPPLVPSVFIKLPIGSIKPKGWLHRQLALEADGMTGHLEEISKWCKFENSAWASPNGQGQFGWEELPYWLKGYANPFTAQTVPIMLRAKAKIIPAWKLDRFGLVGKLQDSPVKSDEPVETVTLIPMGAARLRIAAFPVNGSSKKTPFNPNSPLNK